MPLHVMSPASILFNINWCIFIFCPEFVHHTFRSSYVTASRWGTNTKKTAAKIFHCLEALDITAPPTAAASKSIDKTLVNIF